MSRNYMVNLLAISLDGSWQPHHWLMPESLTSVAMTPVCGQPFPPDRKGTVRHLHRSEINLLRCSACRAAFERQRTEGKRKKRL